MKKVITFLIVLTAVASLCSGLLVAEAATKSTGKAPDFSAFDWWSTDNSTCFSYVGYDEDQEALAVIFRSNETRLYIYDDFSADDFDAFFSSSSLGKYYNSNIKGQYTCTRYDDFDTSKFSKS